MQLKKKNLTTQTRNGASAQFFPMILGAGSILAAQLKINLVQMGILQKSGGKRRKNKAFAYVLFAPIFKHSKLTVHFKCGEYKGYLDDDLVLSGLFFFFLMPTLTTY